MEKSIIHSFRKFIVAPLEETYSEALPAQPGDIAQV